MQTSFKLDTKAFADAAQSTQKLAEALEGAIAETDLAINNLYENWSGKGRNEFEKKYKICEQQLADIRKGLWNLYEDIIKAEEEYIEADLQAAKSEAGKHSDYS